MSVAWALRFDGTDIPKEWEIRRIGELVSLVNGHPFPSESFGPDGEMPLVRIRDLLTKEFETYVSGHIPLAALLRDGDVVIGMDGDFNLVRWNRGSAALNQRLCALRPKLGTDVDMRFIAYALPATLKVINDLTFSTTVKHLSSSDILSERLPLPPLREQRRIVEFLAAETARIDGLSARRSQQLSLLRERHKERVRDLLRGKSGLDSGGSRSLQWLGEVRNGWSSLPLRRISRVTMGTTFPHEYQGVKSGDYPFIKVSDFLLANRFGHLGRAENWVTDPVARRLGARIVPSGSVLYARVGAALLLNRRVLTTRKCIVDDNVRAISIQTGDPRYWLNLLSFLDLSQLMNPGPVPSISESQVSSIQVPLLPTAEQTDIADLIEQLQEDQDRLERCMRRQLDLLAERRNALITAAVTGQIDVSTTSGRGIED